MIYEVVISEKALFQIDKYAKWFEIEKPGLEKRFLNELFAVIDSLNRNPKIYQVRYKDVRIKFLKKFEFGIHFIIEKEVVYILFIFHTHQNSEDWFL